MAYDREKKRRAMKQWEANNKERRSELSRRHYQKHKAKINKKTRDRYAKNKPEARARARGYKLKSEFGITIEEYDRMLVMQNGVCAICRKPCKTGKRLAVDHDHSSGRVRGLLCQAHNTALGQFEDDPVLLRAAAAYVESFHAK